MVRNTYIYPPEPSMRIVSDIFAYTAARDAAGSTRSRSAATTCRRPAPRSTSSSAYTLADGIDYVRAGVAAGMSVDAFAPRLSFFWNAGMNYFMEIAKQRAAPAAVGQADARASSRPKDARSLTLRAHTQTSGWSLAAQDVFNNVAAHHHRGDGGGRPARPRACTPTRSTRRSRCRPTSRPASPATPSSSCSWRAASTRTIDPWGGSYYVERLTHDLAARALDPHRRGRGAGRHGQGDRPGPAASGASRRPPRAPRRASTPAARPWSASTAICPTHADDIPLLKVDNSEVLRQPARKARAAEGRARPGRGRARRWRR